MDRFKHLTDQYDKDGWGDKTNHQFQIHHASIASVERNQFADFDEDDPHAHLTTFLDACATLKPPGVPRDVVLIRMFGNSLIGAALKWYQSLDRGKVITWSYISPTSPTPPASKAQELLDKIFMFEQHEDEMLHEAWGRFKEVLFKCPDHNQSEGDLLVRFYKGLTYQTVKELDYASKGGFLQGSAKTALEVIEREAKSSLEWSKRRRNKSSNAKRNDLLATIDKLKKEKEALKMAKFSINALEKDTNAQLVEEVSYLQGGFH